MIIECPTCLPHEFQDNKYGWRKRVANPCKGGEHARCTICKKETRVREKSEVKPTEEKKK